MGIEKIVGGLLGFDGDLKPKPDAVSRVKQMLIPGSIVMRYYGLAKLQYTDKRDIRRAVIASVPQEALRVMAYGLIIYWTAFFPI